MASFTRKEEATTLGAQAMTTDTEIEVQGSWFERIMKKLEVTDGNAVGYNPSFTNPDLLLVPEEKRVWGKRTYSLYWFGECASVTAWTVASTGVTSGLSWWESWICVILGTFIVACAMVATGRAGATYNIPFPVVARASWGVWGSYWPIINRDIMTTVWSGVQFVTIRHYDRRTPDWICVRMGYCLALTSIKPTKMSDIIVTKTIIMICCLIVFFAWTVAKAHGIGAVVYQPASIPASQSHAWVFLNNLFLQASNMATFATNNTDISRYARRPNDAKWAQLFGVPIAYGFVAFFGIFVTSASKPVLGELLWDPTDILDEFLMQNYDTRTRCGVFFITLGFSYAQCTTMIFANLIAAGNDTSALSSRYINFRGGAMLVLIICFAINPWQLTKTSFTFTTYLGACDIFLAAIIGVLVSDYYLVRKGKYNVSGVFSLERSAPYYFFKGWNWKAYAAYLLGMVPVFPGFLASIGVSGIPLGAQRLYVFAFPMGIFVSAMFYWGINIWIPPEEGIPSRWSEPAAGEVDAVSNEQFYGGKAEEETVTAEKSWDV